MSNSKNIYMKYYNYRLVFEFNNNKKIEINIYLVILLIL